MWSEFRFAVRALRAWRTGSLAAILTLAIGIGTTAALYALARAAVPELPGVPDVDRVGRVYAMSASLGVDRGPVALNEFDATLSRTRTFVSIGAYAQTDATLGSGSRARPIVAGYASPAFFTVMGVAPVAGRTFTAPDAAATRPVVIVSESLWQRERASEDLSRASIVIDGVERVIVGVMPRAFSYEFVGIHADAWVPLGHASPEMPAIVTVFGRLRPGVPWSDANAELTALGRAQAQWVWRAIPIEQDVRRRAAGVWTLTFGPALLVLVMGCINVACMLTARGIDRGAELSVRRALGASRVRIIRQLTIEHAILAFAGGVPGCALAVVLLRTAAGAISDADPGMATRIATGFDALPVAAGSMVLACMLFGTLPALRLSRRGVAGALAGVPPGDRIHVGGYGARDLIVFFETGSAVALILFAAMAVNFFSELRRVSPLFAADDLVGISVPAPAAAAARSRVAAVAGATRVAVTSSLPGSMALRSDAAYLETDGDRRVAVSRVAADASLFDTMRLPIVRGRSFDVDDTGASRVVVVSESAARALAPDADAIGLRVRIVDGTSVPAIVIGISRDAMEYGSLSRAGLVLPEVYTPYEPPRSGRAFLLVRAHDARTVIDTLAMAARSAGQSRPSRAWMISDLLRPRERAAGVIAWRGVGLFALTALLIAASGIFGVVSQSVAQRTTELGVRVAVGASARRVLGMVLARETKLIAAAIACGTVTTIALTQAMFIEVAALSVARPSIVVQALALCGGMAGGAGALATWRILRLDPAAVLRRH